jgi:hypothetical protein
MLRARRGLRECARVMIIRNVCIGNATTEGIMQRESEKRDVTVLSHLVPAEFHQAQKGTRHRACIILYVNTILYLRTLAIEGSEGLLYLKQKK